MQIEKIESNGYARFRIPGMVLTENGTLLAYYECRRSNSDWADIDLKVIRSTDDGESWETVGILEGKGDTLNNPVMFVKGQQIHLLFLRNYKKLFHCVSTDDGKTFSEPQQRPIDCSFFYNAVAVGPGHGIVHDGKMIVPIWFAQNEDDPWEHRPSLIATFYSEDGENWRLGEQIGKDVLVNPSEGALAVTSKNEVMISIRNGNDCRLRALAYSGNGCCGWRDLRLEPELPDPECMGSMCHENGTVYHINCASKTGRENLTVKISDGSFQSYESIFVDSPAGYSDIAVKDGKLYILYERDFNEGGLWFQKVSLQGISSRSAVT